MRVVAITRLATPVEDEARALAASLGTLPYEERQKLGAGLPAIVMSTPDVARADALAQELRLRGHGTITCDTAEVVAAGAMVGLREFRFEPAALVARAELAELELPWTDIAVMLRATHRAQTRRTKVVTERRLALGKALVTGGLVSTTAKRREVVSNTDETEPVLYLFRRTAATPWILAQHHARFGALGAGLATTAAPNFIATVEHLRARAPDAIFDDRLVARKGTPADVDLLAHLLATWLASGSPGPYRA